MIYKNEEITKVKVNNKFFKKILEVILIAIIIFLVYTFSLILVSLKSEDQSYIFGMKAYIIETDSMAPELNGGDLIIVRKCQINDLKRNQIITFINRGQIVTHRILSINYDTKKIYTKGDNNNVEDIEPTDFENVVGTIVLKAPGFEVIEFHLRKGVYLALIMMIILTLFLHNQRINRKKLMRRKKKKIEDKKNELFKEDNQIDH